MNIDRVILAFAGSMILITLLLSQIHSIYWLWFTAFVGGQPAAVQLHRFLSDGEDSQTAGPQTG